MIYNNILEVIGKTPIIELHKTVHEAPGHIYVKFEGCNIGGSIKTRTAYRMIEDAKKNGLINKNTTIVEPTSGNQGIGLALIASVYGLKAKIVMPDSVSEERRKLIEHYGAEVILIHDEGDIGECIDKCIKKAKEMATEKNIYMPSQFENYSNVDAQYYGTAKEIIKDVDFNIDGFCSGIGTGGTITGVGKALKEKYKNIKIWALEPENAAILQHKKVGSHIQMGIGDGVIPKILNQNIIDKIITIKDEEALHYAKSVAKNDGIACGITGGTNIAGAIIMSKELGKNSNIVTILPDTAERYFSTSLFG